MVLSWCLPAVPYSKYRYELNMSSMTSFSDLFEFFTSEKLISIDGKVTHMKDTDFYK